MTCSLQIWNNFIVRDGHDFGYYHENLWLLILLITCWETLAVGLFKIPKSLTLVIDQSPVQPNTTSLGSIKIAKNLSMSCHVAFADRKFCNYWSRMTPRKTTNLKLTPIYCCHVSMRQVRAVSFAPWTTWIRYLHHLNQILRDMFICSRRMLLLENYLQIHQLQLLLVRLNSFSTLEKNQNTNVFRFTYPPLHRIGCWQLKIRNRVKQNLWQTGSS